MIEEYLSLLPGADVRRQFGKLTEVYETCSSKKYHFLTFASKAPL